MSDLREMYEAHASYVYASLGGLGLDASDLEDALQEVFLLVHRRRGSLDLDRPIRPWLFGVCRNVVRHHRRRRAVRDRLRFRVAEPPSTVDGVATAEQLHARHLLMQCLENLPGSQREVWVLAELHQLSRPEIAEFLRVSPNTVGSRLRLARQAFARQVARARARDARANAALSSGEHRQCFEPTSRERARAWVAISAGLGRRAVPIVGGVGVAELGLATVGILGAAAVGAALAASPNPATPGSSIAGPSIADEPLRVEGENSHDVGVPDVAAPDEPPEDRLTPSDERPEAQLVFRRRSPVGGGKPSSAREGDMSPSASTDTLSAQAAWIAQAQVAAQAQRWDVVIEACDAYRAAFADGSLAIECARLERRALCALRAADGSEESDLQNVRNRVTCPTQSGK